MSLPIYQVDAFTSQPFRGNPAGVCLLQKPMPDAWMQDVAREMNLSETAFLLPEGDGFRLRWFTPAVEVALCGHATLGSAHTLWETGRLQPAETARFHTLSGLLTARRVDGRIELDFPVKPVEPADAPPGMLQALGLPAPLFVGRSQFDYLVEVDAVETVRAARPDFASLAGVDARGVIVTSRGAGGVDFVSRFFAPRVGVNEDPVTGSAHCALAHYWAGKLGRTTFVAHQVSARGGELSVRLEGERVLLGGQAVTVIRGELDA